MWNANVISPWVYYHIRLLSAIYASEGRPSIVPCPMSAIRRFIVCCDIIMDGSLPDRRKLLFLQGISCYKRSYQLKRDPHKRCLRFHHYDTEDTPGEKT